MVSQLAAAQHAAANDTHLFLHEVIGKQRGNVSTVNRVEVACFLDFRSCQSGGFPELQRMFEEEPADAGYLLRVDKPNGLSFVDGVDVVDVRADIASWMWTAEVVFLHVLDSFKQFVLCVFPHTEMYRGVFCGQTQHFKSVSEMFLFAAHQYIKVGS